MKQFYFTKNQLETVERALARSTEHLRDQIARCPSDRRFEAGREYLQEQLNEELYLRQIIFEFLLKR